MRASGRAPRGVEGGTNVAATPPVPFASTVAMNGVREKSKTETRSSFLSLLLKKYIQYISLENNQYKTIISSVVLSR